MFKGLLNKIKRDPLSKDLPYEEAREVLEREDDKSRHALATREDAPPETLYFLASDEDVTVRREVAANPSTPPQANIILADDVDDDVRCELAGKIRRLLPHLSEDEVETTRELTFQLLNKLAADELPRVRQIVAEEIKHSKGVPRDVVLKLANDSHAIVAAPILEYSPMLTDDDLLEVIAAAHFEGVIETVANRENLSEDMSDAVVATLEIPAIANLLANKSAQVREDTMETIVEQAQTYSELEEPIVLRADLSLRTMRRLAQFVAISLLETLNKQGGMDARVVATVRRRSRQRIHEGDHEQEDEADQKADALSRIKKAAKAGTLDDEMIATAADAGDRIFVITALAHLMKVKFEDVEKVFDAKSTKGVSAVTWKAGLSMRISFRIQKEIFKLPSHKLLLARQGVYYPLPDDEMIWQLDYFGLPTR